MQTYGKLSNPHSPIWANSEQTIINLMVTIDGHTGEHPFSASSFDAEKYGADLFADAAAGAFGPIGAYVPPPAEALEITVRQQRNTLLRQSDWTQLPDVPQAIKDVWAPYRQALRDVPQQSGFPANIVWPNPPA